MLVICLSPKSNWLLRKFKSRSSYSGLWTQVDFVPEYVYKKATLILTSKHLHTVRCFFVRPLSLLRSFRALNMLTCHPTHPSAAILYSVRLVQFQSRLSYTSVRWFLYFSCSGSTDLFASSVLLRFEMCYSISMFHSSVQSYPFTFSLIVLLYRILFCT